MFVDVEGAELAIVAPWRRAVFGQKHLLHCSDQIQWRDADGAARNRFKARTALRRAARTLQIDGARPVILADLFDLERLISVRVLRLPDPGTVKFDLIANLDAGGIALNGVDFCVARLQSRAVWAGNDTTLECVVAMIDCYNRDNGNGGADPDRGTNHFALARTDTSAACIARCR